MAGQTPEPDPIHAVWYGTDAIVVLGTPSLLTKERAHAPRRHDRFVVKRLDARTLRLLDEVSLPLEDNWNHDGSGWDPRRTVSGFLRDGSLVVALAAPRWERRNVHWSEGRIPRTQGAAHVTLRLSATGTTTILHRGRWRSATVTPRGDVVGIQRRAGRAVLLGIDAQGQRLFRRAFDDYRTARIVAGHAHGACVRGDAASDSTATLIACFDRNADPLWQRVVPWVGDWIVDDAGWVYISIWNAHALDPDDAVQITAIDPEGTTVWSVPGDPSLHGMMLVGENEICYVTQPPKGEVPELVCIEPRHGRR
ncbi:MAG: hypothetical protein IAG13_27470 [Deltaproteobacteria bacterium]|nr:hypothetical protein [Nannocystaceae bacterium]